MLNIFKKKSTLPKREMIAAFGKLPVHSEFIKHRTIIPPFIALERWYEEAFREANQSCGPEFKHQLLQMPPYGFLFYEPPFSLIGATYSSQDSSGRYYPFTIARLMEQPIALEFISSAPLLYEEYFQAIEAFFQEPWKSKTLTEMGQQIAALCHTALDLKKPISLERVLSILKTTPIHCPLDSEIEKIKKFPEWLAKKERLGIRLPLPNSQNLLSHTVFYLQWFESVMTLTSKRFYCYFQQGNLHQEAQFLLLFSPLPSKDWKTFLQPGSTSPDFSHSQVLNAFQPFSHIDPTPQPTISLYNALQKYATLTKP